jgi:hypothetical protein
MAKTQTITLKKSGSSWSSYDEALADVHAAISATPPSTDDYVGNTLPHVPTTEAVLDVDTQTVTEVRVWDDAEYTTYKDGITGIETDVTNALIAAGWEITDTVV